MKFEIVQNVEQWCQEALREIDGTPAAHCEKVRAAACVYQVKILSDISRKLSGIPKGKTPVRASLKTR